MSAPTLSSPFDRQKTVAVVDLLDLVHDRLDESAAGVLEIVNGLSGMHPRANLDAHVTNTSRLLDRVRRRVARNHTSIGLLDLFHSLENAKWPEVLVTFDSIHGRIVLLVFDPHLSEMVGFTLDRGLPLGGSHDDTTFASIPTTHPIPGLGAAMEIQVRDQMHKVVYKFCDSDSQSFIEFCEAGSNLGMRYTDFIHMYTDSMLNYFQLDAWAEDLSRVLGSDELTPDQREVAEIMLDASWLARSMSGYLFFAGQ